MKVGWPPRSSVASGSERGLRQRRRCSFRGRSRHRALKSLGPARTRCVDHGRFALSVSLCTINGMGDPSDQLHTELASPLSMSQVSGEAELGTPRLRKCSRGPSQDAYPTGSGFTSYRDNPRSVPIPIRDNLSFFKLKGVSHDIRQRVVQ